MVTRRYFLPGSYEYLRYAATGQYSGSRITKVGAEGGLLAPCLVSVDAGF